MHEWSPVLEYRRVRSGSQAWRPQPGGQSSSNEAAPQTDERWIESRDVMGSPVGLGQETDKHGLKLGDSVALRAPDRAAAGSASLRSAADGGLNPPHPYRKDSRPARLPGSPTLGGPRQKRRPALKGENTSGAGYRRLLGARRGLPSRRPGGEPRAGPRAYGATRPHWGPAVPSPLAAARARATAAPFHSWREASVPARLPPRTGRAGLSAHRKVEGGSGRADEGPATGGRSGLATTPR